jgi:hypothetical protein
MSEFTQKLGEIVTAGMSHTHEAQRRMWAASDEVARLRRDLSSAEERQATAGREYEQSRDLTMQSWESLRDEIVRSQSDEDLPADVH